LGVQKQIAAAVLAPLLVAAPSVARAEQSFPYSCQWISEVTPDAVIRFTSTNGVGSYKGALLYKGKRLMAFQEGQSQGSAVTGGALEGRTTLQGRWSCLRAIKSSEAPQGSGAANAPRTRNGFCWWGWAVPSTTVVTNAGGMTTPS
jgi:hypothetical protein